MAARAEAAGGAVACACAALLALAWAPAAEARVCDRVGKPGGKISTPGKLVRRLRPGQTGCLRAGTYRQRQVIVRTPGVTLRSYPRERATWVGRVVLAAERVTLARLNLDGRAGPPCRVRGCYPADGVLPSPTVNGPRARLVSNDITNPRGICINVRSYYGLTPNRFRVLGNRIHHCRPANNHVHGVYIVNGRRGVVRHNVIYDNGDKGIVLFPDADRELIVGNTIDGNRTGVHFGGGRRSASSRNTVRLNIISFPSPQDGRPARFNVEYHWPGPVGRGNSVRRNCLYTSSDDPFFAGEPPSSGVIPNPQGFAVTGVIASDPLYVDRDRVDFRLREGSPCAGLGAPESVAGVKAWCDQVAPRGSRRRLHRLLWTARRGCFGPRPG